MQSVRNVGEGGQDDVCRKEGFREYDAADSGVVEGALEPLGGVCVGCVLQR